MQYYNGGLPPRDNGEIIFTNGSDGDMSRCLVHRSGNAIELNKSSLEVQYSVVQEGWTRSFIAKDNSSMRLNWCAVLRSREEGLLGWNDSFLQWGNILISGTGQMCTYRHGQVQGDSTGGRRSIQLSGRVSGFMNGETVIYNNYGGNAVNISNKSYLENEYHDTYRYWVWGCLGQYGGPDSDDEPGGGYGSGYVYAFQNSGPQGNINVIGASNGYVGKAHLNGLNAFQNSLYYSGNWYAYENHANPSQAFTTYGPDNATLWSTTSARPPISFT